jgi:phage terminase large subunit GpA-like protein
LSTAALEHPPADVALAGRALQDPLIAEHLAQAAAVLYRALSRTVAPRKHLPVSEWADKQFVVSSKTGGLSGPWRTAANPPLKEPLDAMSARSAVRECVLKFPIQFGKSMVGTICVGYWMEHAPGPTMVALPGEVSMKKFIDQKLEPMLESVPVVRALLTSTASRDGANRREFKDFEGGQLYIEHAGSPQRLKSTSVKNLIVDEWSEFATSLHSGDDPGTMLEGRNSAFPFTFKRLKISTPGIVGLCRTSEDFEASDQRHYHVACPTCGEEQALVWAGLHWGPGGSDVHYCCGVNGCRIEEHNKTEMIRRGRWVPRHPERKQRGYTINCLYYQFGLGPRWETLVQMWLAAQNDPAKLKTFINDRLAEAWEDPAMRAVKHNTVRDRAEPYPLRTAPPSVLCITAGVDTQDDRLEVQIIGWGRNLSSWVLDYAVLPGDPADERVWDALTELLNRPLAHAAHAGAVMHVEATAIDMGGHRTEDVKHYVRSRRARRLLCIHGAVPNNAPVLGKGKASDVTRRGKTDRKGVLVHQVGTVAAKHWLYGRLSVDGARTAEEADKRTTHFSAELDADYFRGLTSETFDPRRNRFEKKRGARNEPLDTWVYAFAAAHHPELRLHRHSKADWDARAARLAPPAGTPANPAPAPVADPAQRPAQARPPATAAPLASPDWSNRL